MTGAKIISRFPAGIVIMPPSKSLSHRALICSALAARNGGTSRIGNLGRSEDIGATIRCMEQLSAQITRRDNAALIEPTQVNLLQNGGAFDCGESGSTLRFLLPIAALDDSEHVFSGRGRLMQRPLEVYSEVFAKSCVHFELDGSTAKLRGPLRSGRYSLPGNVSSQFVSGLLFALPQAIGDSEIRINGALESAAYVKMTIDVMARFGVQVIAPDDKTFLIPGNQSYRAAEYSVEGDYSQAAFFLAAAALGRPVKCAGLTASSIQGDAAVLDIIGQMGARISFESGLVSVRADGLKAATIDAREIPDLIPPLAALCCFCERTSRIVNAGRLRLKESDRLRAICEGLGRLGAIIEEGDDSLTITGQKSLRGGNADAHGDHRIAMMIATAAIGCREIVSLTGWQHVDKSYPSFWDDFEKEAKNG